MPSVKERASAYESMLAKRNGARPAKSVDPLQSAVPHQARHALDKPGAARDAYIQGVTPYFGQDESPIESKKKGKEPTGSSIQAPLKSEELVDSLHSAPPVDRGPSQSEVMESAWAGVDGVARIAAAPPDVGIRSSDVHALANFATQATSFLAAMPGRSPLVGPLMKQVQALHVAASAFINIEVMAQVPDVDKVDLLQKRANALMKVRAAATPLLPILAGTPQGPVVTRMLDWINARHTKVIQAAMHAQVERAMARDNRVQRK